MTDIQRRFLNCCFDLRRLLLLRFANIVHAEVHTFTEQVHASKVMREIHAAVVVNAERFSGRKSILIRSQELKLPVVRGLLVLNTAFDVLRRVFTTGVLHAVSDDDAKDVLRTLFFIHVGELMANGVDGDANRIIKSGMRTSIRKFDAAVAADAQNANEQLSATSAVIDKAASKGVIHKNAANRKKARLAKQLTKAAN